MLLKFWGTRGSIPSPLRDEQVTEKLITALEIAGQQGIDLTDPQAIRAFVHDLGLQGGTVGGNTTCMSIEIGKQLIIIDAGSGLRELGRVLMDKENLFAQRYGFYEGRGQAHIFFTHTHWDHVQGLPFFIPLYLPGNAFDIYHIHDHVPKALVRQMEQEFFPLQFSQVSASFRFHQLAEGEQIELGAAKIHNIELKHPGKAYAYRIEADEGVLVIATDAEYTDLGFAKLKKYYDFYANADALIFDAMFSVREAFVKEDWGHSSALIGADIAREANVKKLYLSHHDPISTDEEVVVVLQQTKQYLHHKKGTRPEVAIAREGMAIEIPEGGNTPDFWIKDYTRNGIIVMELRGKFGPHATEPFQEHLSQSLKQHQANKVLLKMDALTELTTAGIRALVETNRQVDHLALVGVPLEIHQVFQWAAVTDFFLIYDNDDVAFEALLTTDKPAVDASL